MIYAQLEDQVIARVKAASDSNALGYRLAHVESYGGEFDDDTFFTQFRRFPAVWVTVGGDKPKRLGPTKWQCALQLAVMVGARSPRGERNARRGSVEAVGAYQMQQDVRDLLTNQDLGLPIARLAPGASRTLFNTRIAGNGLAVFAQEFATSYTYTPPDGAETVPDITAIGLRYYLKPGDEQPDLEDLLTLGNP
nr:phage protein Gp37 [Azonexus sp. R2A61]